MPPKTDAYQAPDLSLTLHQRCLAIKKALADDPNYEGWDTSGLRNVELIKADPVEQTTLWELTITPIMCNKGQSLHGGCAATILDSLTSTALLTVARPGFMDGGHVSRTLSCTYLRPVPRGARVQIQSWVQAAGKKTANIRGEIRTMDGKRCVTCVHDKAVLPKPTRDDERQKAKL